MTHVLAVGFKGPDNPDWVNVLVITGFVLAVAVAVALSVWWRRRSR